MALPIAAITILAGALRLIGLQHVANDPIYDACVLSMGRSLHNFLFGAFEPGGSVAIDKPPLDLWLQVLSVKILGFGSFSLKLPEALSGTLAVPFLYDTIRRAFGRSAGRSAGLAAASVLAVLPIAVLTARSDTMDSMMMLMLVVAAWCIVRGAAADKSRWFVAAGAAAGIAFNIKLLEAFVALPALAAMLLFTTSGDVRRRMLRLALTIAVFVAVSMSWLVCVSLWPSHSKPFPMGSTNGQYWQTVFVYNGLTRIRGSASELPKLPPRLARKQIAPPSASRLFTKWGPLSGRELGFAVFGGLLFGGAAALFALVDWRRRRLRRDDIDRLAAGTAAGLAIWMLVGIAVFSKMVRLYPRYVEAFTPAVAATFGAGFALLAARAELSRAARLTLALGVVAAGAYLAILYPGARWPLPLALGATLAGLALAAAGVFAWRNRPSARRAFAVGGVTLAFGGLLLPSFYEAVRIVSHHRNDSTQQQQAMPARDVAKLSRFFRLHTTGMRYEFAVGAALRASQLIVKDGRPVLVMTAVSRTVVTSVDELSAAVRGGQVRYALIGKTCRPGDTNIAYCSAPALWVQRYGRDISRQLGLSRSGVLFDLKSLPATGQGSQSGIRGRAAPG